MAGKIDPSLQAALLKASGESLKLSNNLKKSGKELNSVGTIAKGAFLGDLAARGVSDLSSKLWEFGKEGLKLASDLNEVQNVVDTTFGQSANKINDWSKTALKAYGLSELQAKQYSGTMGAMLKSSGVAGDSMIKMSENLAALSGDFASFYNLKQEEAFEKIRSGISGETEPLKQLGINMSVANLEAFALSRGINTSYEKMDQASQTLLRYNYLMSVSKDAQGDFGKTVDQFANQQRLFDTNLKQMSSTIAQKALPYLTQFLQKGNDFVMNVDIAGAAEKAGYWFGIMGDGAKWVYDHSNILIPVLSGLAFTITAFKVVGTVNNLMDAWKKSTFAMTWAQQGLNVALRANPVGLIITALGLLVMAGVYVYRNWDAVKAKALELWGVIQNNPLLSFVLRPIIDVISAGILLYQNWDTIKLKALEMWVDLKNSFAEGVNYAILKINLLIDGINRVTGKHIATIDLVSYDTSMNSMGGLRAIEAQGFASGGIAYTPSIFGESGPEIAIPLERTPRSLTLLNQAQRIIGGPPAPSVQLTYNPIIYGGNRAEIEPVLKQHKEEIRSMLEEILADKARVSYGQ